MIRRLTTAIVALAALCPSTARSGRSFALYTTQEVTGEVLRYDATGAATTFASTGLSFPVGLAFDTSGNLYVANSFPSGSESIREFSPSGHDLGNFASTGLSDPYGLAFDAAGNLYVSNTEVFGPSRNTIHEFSRSGQDLGTFASGLTDPKGLAFDAAGNLYVADSVNVHRFSPSGKDLGIFASAGIFVPEQLAFDRYGNLYVANLGFNNVREFSPSGQDLGVFASAGLSFPQGLAFDAAGNLYVSTFSGGTFGGTIREFSPSGQDLGVFAQSFDPAFLAFGPSVVPEPSSFVLASLGIAGLAFVACWRRGHQIRRDG